MNPELTLRGLSPIFGLLFILLYYNQECIIIRIYEIMAFDFLLLY
jgi:hypothetical protein